MNDVFRRGRWPWVAASVAAALMGIGAFTQVPPVVWHLPALVAWLLATSRRLGPLLGPATTVTAWLGSVLAATSLAGVLGVAPSSAATVAVAATLLALPMLAPPPPWQRGARSLLGAASLGPLSWAGALAMSAFTPRASGLSWAMYLDSTLNVWEARRILADGATPSVVSNANPQPLLAGATVAMVTPGTEVDAASENVERLLLGYASAWSLLIVIGCLLAGLLVAWPLWSAGRRRFALVTAATASLVPLIGAVSGVLLDLGQANGHLVVVIALASLMAAIARDASRPVALGVVAAGMGLLCASWLPFAALPGFLLVGHMLRGLRVSQRSAWLPMALPGLAMGMWATAVYGLPLTVDVLTGALPDPAGGPLLGATTYSREGYWSSYTNPVSIVLLALLGLSVLVCVAAAWRLKSSVRVPVLATGALAVGAAALIVPNRGTWPLPYYPAKFLWIAGVVLGLIIAHLVSTLAATRGPTFAACGGAWLLVLTAVAGATAGSHPGFTFVPAQVATGAHYGSHAEVAGAFVSSQSNEQLRLPWRLDPPHDTTVALMASSIGPSSNWLDLLPTWGVLRFFRNDFSAEVACTLADTEPRDLTLVTADPGLEAEIAAMCPGALTVELREDAS